MRILVLLGTEVVFCRVFFSKFCKSFSLELSFVFFVLKQKDEKKSERGIFKFIVLPYPNQSCHFPALFCHLFDVAS